MKTMSKPGFPFARKSQAVHIQRQFYTMASEDGQTAEITMYGEIVDAQPVDYWSGEPIEGEYIIQKDFLDDLEALENAKTITIHMNSLGGDAGVSILIHNRIRELAAKGVELTCIVDGVAMSGGSLIMCACDTVQVNPSSLVMIHKCWSFMFGGYNADEMRQMAAANDAWDKAQVAIYKRKCGLSDAVISHMMGDTTYMTGQEAVEKGFADSLIEDAEPARIAASADGRSLFVNGRQMHLAPGMFAPDNIPTVTPEAQAPGEADKNPPENSGSEGGNNTMTLEELRQQHPELVAQVEAEARAAAATPPAGGTDPVAEAVQAEQRRLREIDEVAGTLDAALVQEAKYGKTACSAQELCYRAAKQAGQKGHKFLGDLEADIEASGAGKVPPAPNSAPGGQQPQTPEQKMAAARTDVKALLGKEK